MKLKLLKISNKLKIFKKKTQHTNPLTKVKMLINSSEIKNKIENLSMNDSFDLKDEKQKNKTSEIKFEMTVDTKFILKSVTNNKIVKNNLEKFAEKLELKNFTENKDEWKKFYIFVGSSFVWPSTMNFNEHHEVFDYITCPNWDPTGEELARNTIKYRCLLESGTLDKSKGTYILIVHGELIEYGGNISSEEEEELYKKYPGCFYAPVVERFIIIR
ncbi:hypothetical protein Glove_26g200 [Diversispora epigaea]|uniref:Uncharacterized protein n=1 Tax=Diversispora epigaea TaxID=1348612 RepID=A0A397JMZ0_9GLOM|nr:hypothetical protein Glove_26g200 [Diversispora epigaea]